LNGGPNNRSFGSVMALIDVKRSGFQGLFWGAQIPRMGEDTGIGRREDHVDRSFKGRDIEKVDPSSSLDSTKIVPP
jgi:hypothetical protein